MTGQGARATDNPLVSGAAFPYADRREAGIDLASHLTVYAGRSDLAVFGLPRGGVPVAYEVAVLLRAPLDVFLVRKLGLPGHPELAMGAIASGGVRVMNDDVLKWSGVSRESVEAVIRSERAELERRERLYRQGRMPIDCDGRLVVLVDDGLATGSSMTAAVMAVRVRNPSKIVVAVPVGAAETCSRLSGVADAVVCARTPEPFSAVGLWYRDFSQTSDDEVRALLDDCSGQPDR